ncbi:MAG: hypothetical protein AAFY56_23275, partial [Pseudomonadota bacterium]
KPKRSRKRGGKSRSKAAAAKSDDAVETREVEGGIPGMDVVEPEGDDEGLVPDPEEGSSPVDRVAETPDLERRLAEPGDLEQAAAPQWQCFFV